MKKYEYCEAVQWDWRCVEERERLKNKDLGRVAESFEASYRHHNTSPLNISVFISL